MNNKKTVKSKRRWLIIIPGVLVMLLLLGILSGYLWLRQSLPQLEGQIITSGVAEQVTLTILPESQQPSSDTTTTTATTATSTTAPASGTNEES